MRVRWLGHASTVLDLWPAWAEAATRVLTDPLLRRHAGLLRRRGGAPEHAHWADPAAVLISHLHYDHAELGSLALLPGVPLLSAPANARWLRGRQLRGVGLDHDWWSPAGSGVRIRTVAAVHADRPMPSRPNAAVGFLLVADGMRVWFAGDTAPYPAMADLPAIAGGPIDLALVPVGGWGPRLSGGHMDPRQAARAVAAVGARVAVPVHWGTLHAPVSRSLPPGWMDEAGPAFAAAVHRETRATTVHVLAPGESVEVCVGGPTRR